MFEPSDRRTEWRKWFHYFENTTAIAFFASLSDYDQTLDQDGQSMGSYWDHRLYILILSDGPWNTTILTTPFLQNRVQETLTLFDSICNSPWLAKTSITLLLDVDGFAEKLHRIPLADHFPDYTGGSHYDSGCLFTRTICIAQRDQANEATLCPLYQSDRRFAGQL
ncbi:guanine nucleotide binding protein, alpha subunit [Mycena galopus ATCC 62051]|nr:guanine nucleotide binding protein, alpha subunit [Mycena galopus ATCC 62051]